MRTLFVCCAIALLAVGAFISSGCNSFTDDAAAASGAKPAEAPETADLQVFLDKVLDDTFQERRLTLEKHAAWQILHGVLAYQQAFPVGKEGKLVSAVEHLLKGGRMSGWEIEVVPHDKGAGLRALLNEGSKAGQGHADQWLAVLAQCGLKPEQVIELNGQKYAMSDLVEQVERDVPRNMKREYSWTLIGLTTYRPTTFTWTASDGNQWSIERLMQIEVEQELETSACGGTHRLIGMAMALNRHLEQGGTVDGVWKEADEVIRNAVDEAKKLQNPDGSFSTNYFAMGGSSPDLAQNLGTTGHTLEFLALAMTDEELKQDWVRKSVGYLCDVFRKTRYIDLECGKLYHAAHGLVLYRERVFGHKEYKFADLELE